MQSLISNYHASFLVEADRLPLLTFANAKTSKGEKLVTPDAPHGILTGILYLTPADESGIINVCPKASPGCKASCLATAGRAAFQPNIPAGRLRKTRLFVEKPAVFMATLRKDIQKLVRKAEKTGMRPAVRINGTSDLPALARLFAREFSAVQCYDYTKLPKPETRMLPNYHLTFSRSEDNEADARAALAAGVNVAVVFSTMRGRPLPTTYLDAPVIDGDLHDYRPADVQTGVIVGLRAKGRARKDVSGFTVPVGADGEVMRAPFVASYVGARPVWADAAAVDTEGGK
jgi:hypothetical protein